MSKEEVAGPKDCTACRLVGGAGLTGIGAYLANYAWKNKTVPGKITLSAFSLTFVSLGIARFNQTYPFDKKENEFEKRRQQKQKAQSM